MLIQGIICYFLWKIFVLRALSFMLLLSFAKFKFTFSIIRKWNGMTVAINYMNRYRNKLYGFEVKSFYVYQ